MKKNMGYLDRAFRSIFAVVVAVLYFAGYINGIAAIVLGAMAVVFLTVSIIGYCPLYAPLKWNTVQYKDPEEKP